MWTMITYSNSRIDIALYGVCMINYAFAKAITVLEFEVLSSMYVRMYVALTQ